MKKLKSSFIFFSCLLVLYCVACNDLKKNKSHRQTSDASIKAGKKLAAQYCASCHQLPDPSLADAKSWENGILPEMGPRLGIFFLWR